MTAEEIRAKQNECDDGAWQNAEWQREIAAQLAELNEFLRKTFSDGIQVKP